MSVSEATMNSIYVLSLDIHFLIQGPQAKPKFLFPDSFQNTDLLKRKKETYLLPAVCFCVAGFLSLLTDFQFFKLL